MENIIYSGVTSAEPKSTDFTIGSNMIPITIENAPYADQEVVEANQNRDPRYYYTCVIHASCGAICDFWNTHDLYESFVEECVTEAVNTGVLNLSQGMNVSDGVDVARRVWNRNHPDKMMNSFRIPFADKLLQEVLEKGHSAVTAYRGNGVWDSDSSDGILSKGLYSPTTYAHSVRYRATYMVKSIVNSYKGVVSNNIYKAPLMNSLVTNGVNFWDCFYIFLPQEWQDEETEYRLNAVKLGISNGERPNDKATRWECLTMIARKIHGKLATASVLIPSIWNGLEGERVITEEECNTVFDRAGLPRPRNTTRGAIAEVLGR